VNKSIKDWDLKLPHAEFAYNSTPSFVKYSDLVWLHLGKERLPLQKRNKLILRWDSPFKVLGKVDNNAYKLEFPSDIGVSPTFNVRISYLQCR